MGLSKLVKSLLLFALLLYFVFLVVARTPATWGAWAVHQAAPNVWLTGVSGTLWDGRASGGAVVVGNQTLALTNVTWNLKPLSLLALKACAEVHGNLLDQPAAGIFCASPGNVLEARDVQLSAPMAVIGAQFNLNIGGQVSTQLQHLRVDDQQIQELAGNISWRDARWNNGERWISLGSYAAKLTPNEQGGVHADIFELDGPFKVNLAGDLVAGREPSLKGTVAASPEAPEQITSALEFVGQPMEDGSFRVAWPPGT